MSNDYYNWRAFNTSDPIISELKEYGGERMIRLSCTQLPESKYPAKSERDGVLEEWIDFLENNPTALEKLELCSSANQKLFDAICCQEDLLELTIKCGRYPDLSSITNLSKLKCLWLRGSGSTKDLSPLASLTRLEALVLENFTGTADYSALASLINLKQLWLESGMDSVIKVDNLEFLRGMKDLRNLQTSGFRLLNHDYEPVLGLSNLEYLSVNMVSKDYYVWNGVFAEAFPDIKYNSHLPD